jgi:hypothetical protein
MSINRVLTLAAIFVTATIFLYLSGPHRQLRRTRVYAAKVPNQPEAELAQVTQYLREACPDMVLMKEEGWADYTILASWYGPPAWNVFVSGKGRMIYWKGNRDAMEAFRQACAAIRDDAKEVAAFDASMQSLPVGRYSLMRGPPAGDSANLDHVFLLDTKTGAVWELKPIGDTQEFERMSVDGLYKNRLR